MKKTIVIGVVILALLIMTCTNKIMAMNLGEVQEKTTNIYQNENIVFVGDSIFDWYPTDKIFSDFPIVNSGVCGNKTTDILKDMEKRIYRYNPTKVFIHVGTNDIEWGDSEELNIEVARNIEKIAEGVRKNRSQSEVYIISIYPVNNSHPGVNERHISEIKIINSLLKKYCAETDGVEYIDAYNQLTGTDGLFDEAYTDDGLHPNGLGYAKITEILMKYIYK